MKEAEVARQIDERRGDNSDVFFASQQQQKQHFPLNY